MDKSTKPRRVVMPKIVGFENLEITINNPRNSPKFDPKKESPKNSPVSDKT